MSAEPLSLHAGRAALPGSTHAANTGELSRFAAIRWSPHTLADNHVWCAEEFWVSSRAKGRRYAFRMLRYWFMEHLLTTERARLGRPLKVLEIGVDRGQTKAYIDGALRNASGEADALYTSWDAADVSPQTQALAVAGYANCLWLNLDDADSLAQFIGARHAQYDVVILLHVLEHLRQPERATTFVSAAVRTGGIMIGGFPVLPSGVARWRERQLRSSAQPFGHISAFSPRRVRKMAERAGLALEYASGAFAVRASGSWLENHAWWMRLNVAFGALFHGWPGEIYWQYRKR